MSLRDGSKKMSKSDPSDYSRINLTDDVDTIAQKIRKAKTDPHPLPETVKELEARARGREPRRHSRRPHRHDARAGAEAACRRAILAIQERSRRCRGREARHPCAAEMMRLSTAQDHIDAVLADGRSPRKRHRASGDRGGEGHRRSRAREIGRRRFRENRGARGVPFEARRRQGNLKIQMWIARFSTARAASFTASVIVGCA